LLNYRIAKYRIYYGVLTAALACKWGLGVVSWGHGLSLAGLLGVWKIGKEKGIWNRPTESGSRWQCSGHWATDGERFVRRGGPAARADEVIDTAEAIGALRKPDAC
jgi:hypothetical protein